MEELLKHETRQLGVVCTVDSRAKDVASLLKKVLKKRYASSDRVTDKAGARVVVRFLDDVQAIAGLAERLFYIIEYEDKAEALGHDRLGYLGVHLNVTLPESLLADGREDFRGLACEIQVNTAAQRVWADVAHPLSYKPVQETPEDLLRMLNRLVAVMEIFDEQVGQVRKALLSQPRFREAQVLDQLERHFYRLTARQFDPELSLEIIGAVLGSLSGEELTGFAATLDDFISSHIEKLEEPFARYADDQRSLLLFQPESLLVFE